MSYKNTLDKRDYICIFNDPLKYKYIFEQLFVHLGTLYFIENKEYF